MAQLTFNDISVAYDHQLILDHVSLEIPCGKITTLVGKNGCGKSTLLKTLTDTVTPITGSIFIDGKEKASYGRKALAQKMAIMPQFFSAPADMTVEKYITFGRFPYKKFGKPPQLKDHKIIDETIKITDLQKHRHQQISTLSGGERQRARIAMAICQQPEIMVLDEPITHLDISYQLDTLHLIQSINQSLGVTILMVLHDLNLAAKFSDRIYMLDKKEIYTYGAPNQVINEKALQDVFHINIALWEKNPSGKPYFLPLKTIHD